MIKKQINKFFFANSKITGITIIGCLIVVSILSAELSLLLKPHPVVPAKITWSTFDGNESHSGINTVESALAANTVSSLHLLWQKALPYVTDGSPVEAPNVLTSTGTKDLLFITTKKGSLAALDAASGNKVWEADTNNNFVDGQGTSSSPVIDPTGNYVYNYGQDGKVHKYSVSKGLESKTNGFPLTVTQSVDVEKVSAPLTIGNGYLYTVTSGYDGDFGSYVGHVVAINLASGKTSVFNSLCSNVKQLSHAGFCGQKGSGIWGRAGAVVDPLTNNVFVVTGNGNYNAVSGGTNYGDSVIELTADLTRIVDSYTPTGYSNLDSQDDDLGSTGVNILPSQKNTATPHLLVIGGKDNLVRLLNKDNLSGKRGPNHVGGELQTLTIPCQTLAHPISWNDSSNTTWVFFADMCGTLHAYKVVNNGRSLLKQIYEKGGIAKNSPVIANGILYVSISNKVSAVDPTTGNILWSSTQSSAGGNIGSLHWQSPVVVNGTVYMPDNNGNISAYGLTQSSIPTPTEKPVSTPTPTTTSKTAIMLTVFEHGIGSSGDNSNPNTKMSNQNILHKQITVSVQIFTLDNLQIAGGDGTLNYNAKIGGFTGILHIQNGFPSGQYIVMLKTNSHLREQVKGIQTITSGKTNTIPSVTLVAGDINNDNVINILDYNILMNCYSDLLPAKSCTGDQKTASDLNDDGNVNQYDYNLFVREISTQSGS